MASFINHISQQLNRWMRTYTGILRNIRVFHFVYNYLNKEKLAHNEKLYQKYSINKSIYRSISSKEFNNKTAKLPWLDYPVNKSEVKNHPDFLSFDEAVGNGILNWYENGYMLLRNYIATDTIAQINKEIDLLLETEIIQFNYTYRKLFNAFEYSEPIANLINSDGIKAILSFILGRKVFPFQTINFIYGSEQEPHSDWIHMSTFPKGYLIAVWIALEDITLDAGAIAYYPKSHRLPYINNEVIMARNNFFLLDNNANNKAERYIQNQIKTHNLNAEHLIAKKGDVFIWHANLIHGGMPILNKTITRKSMVIHYFAEDVICYHEISERPALITHKV